MAIRLEHVSRVMRKLALCIWENKGPDHLCSNHPANQHLCSHYIDSRIHLLPKSEISRALTFFSGHTARFVFDLVAYPDDRFSHDLALIMERAV